MADVLTETAPAVVEATVSVNKNESPKSPVSAAANTASEDIDVVAALSKFSKVPSSLRSIAPFLEESYGILL